MLCIALIVINTSITEFRIKLAVVYIGSRIQVVIIILF